MENVLNRFFTARVGLRLLTEHHILSDVTRQIENESGGLVKVVWINRRKIYSSVALRVLVILQ